jgi:DNA-binding XRE family transcriptional regulator
MGRTPVKGTAQGEKVRKWRQRVGLTPQDLADYTGFSREAVYQFERGTRPDGSPHSKWTWQRFEMCCAAVEHQMQTGRAFEW